MAAILLSALAAGVACAFGLSYCFICILLRTSSLQPETPNTHTKEATMPQPQLTKLHRSRQHRILAGVMGGIAEYFGWSPTVTRILFVIISCCSVAVPGILIYLILWILMPNATPDSYL